MSHLGELQNAISEIADRINTTPTKVPEYLRGVPPIESIKARIDHLVDSIGGYEILSAKLPIHSGKVWKSIVHETHRYRLNLSDFELILEYFNDSVLLGLLANKFGFYCIQMSAIPASNYSLSDLGWLLRRYRAQSLLLTCDLREDIMDGRPTVETRKKLERITRDTIVLLTQIDLALKNKALSKST